MNSTKIQILLLIPLLFLQGAAASNDYLITEHEPVYPGDTVFIYIPIKNTGYSNLMADTVVKLVPSNNATEKTIHVLDSEVNLGTIDDWNDMRTARFKVHIDQNTLEGEYDFIVYVSTKEKESGNIVTEALKDRVLVVKGIPIITLSNTSISSIAPGSFNEVTLKFRNEGTGVARNLFVDVNTGSEHLASVFSITGSGTRFFLGSLAPGEEAGIKFDMIVDSQAQTGVYNIPIKISGINYSVSDSLGLGVAGITDFELSYQESGSTFLLSVSNVGVNPAKAVSVEIPPQNNFSISGSSTQVIGNLNAGDYTSANFQVSQRAGSLMNIRIQYTDAGGVRQSLDKRLPVRITGGGMTPSASGNDQHAAMHAGTNYSKLISSFVPYIGIVLLGIIGFWQRRSISEIYQRLKYQRQKKI